ncbi:MAG: PHP domain-containing protein [Clostridiales Family XIII bacterium]|jgi:putative hydrolase|nr:PHP domain-containing protein [Clostridiales Family XIII bacterium]
MNIIADLHTHTIASEHAYSTINENAQAAYDAGLTYLATTDHSALPTGGASLYFFSNLTNIPRTLYGVKILRGIEANIINDRGMVDLHPRYMKSIDWVVASFHDFAFPPPVFEYDLEKAKDIITDALLGVIRDPRVHVIGHVGDKRYPFHVDTVMKAISKSGKLVEINANSVNSRPGSEESCFEIASACIAYDVGMTVSSDAHHSSRIGEFSHSIDILERVGAKESHVVNSSVERLEEWFQEHGIAPDLLS